jgi:GNAT superfamily N-acetyltransferase
MFGWLDQEVRESLRPFKLLYGWVPGVKEQIDVAITRLELKLWPVLLSKQVSNISKKPAPFKINAAESSDFTDLTILQKACYAEEALARGDYGITAAAEDSNWMRHENFMFNDIVSLKAETNGIIIGSARARLVGTACCIFRLFVHPSLRRQGIGSALVKSIEGKFPSATKYEVYVGFKEPTRISFLESQGYSLSREYELSDKTKLAYVEKLREP